MITDIDISHVLTQCRPGAEWALTANDYATLQWIGPGEAPTLEEIETAWVELQSAPPPTPTPTMRSFRLACGRVLWTRIAAAVAGITDEDAKWEAQQYILTSPKVTRNHPLVVQLAASLTPPLTDAQIDAVFSLAMKIDAEA